MRLIKYDPKNRGHISAVREDAGADPFKRTGEGYYGWANKEKIYHIIRGFLSLNVKECSSKTAQYINNIAKISNFIDPMWVLDEQEIHRTYLQYKIEEGTIYIPLTKMDLKILKLAYPEMYERDWIKKYGHKR